MTDPKVQNKSTDPRWQGGINVGYNSGEKATTHEPHKDAIQDLDIPDHIKEDLLDDASSGGRRPVFRGPKFEIFGDWFPLKALGLGLGVNYGVLFSDDMGEGEALQKLGADARIIFRPSAFWKPPVEVQLFGKFGYSHLWGKTTFAQEPDPTNTKLHLLNFAAGITAGYQFKITDGFSVTPHGLFEWNPPQLSVGGNKTEQLGDQWDRWFAGVGVAIQFGSHAEKIAEPAVVEEAPPVQLEIQDMVYTKEAGGELTVVTVAEIQEKVKKNPNITKMIIPDGMLKKDGYKIGDYTFELTGKGDKGQDIKIAFIITIEDTKKPDVTVQNITVQQDGNKEYTQVTLEQPTVIDASKVTVTNNVDSVYKQGFRIGDNPVIWTVTDAEGNETKVIQNVTIIASDAPVAWKTYTAPAIKKFDLTDQISFGKNSAELTKAGKEQLSAIWRRLSSLLSESHPDGIQTGTQIYAKFVGHASSEGPASYNLKLSKRRANTILEAFNSQIGIIAAPHSELVVDANNFSSDGKGETELIMAGGKEDKKASRRTEMNFWVIEQDPITQVTQADIDAVIVKNEKLSSDMFAHVIKIGDWENMTAAEKAVLQKEINRASGAGKHVAIWMSSSEGFEKTAANKVANIVRTKYPNVDDILHTEDSRLGNYLIVVSSDVKLDEGEKQKLFHMIKENAFLKIEAGSLDPRIIIKDAPRSV